ncbi:TauD/TfdA family dioxygenase [Candidatus Poriferisodalis sp.]|uniref:TauD/TfdA family dioxygenase n=1 Tax=Candidatus Poriferisodalis sp. TaxID=3101277 RepID=UPI003B02BB46
MTNRVRSVLPNPSGATAGLFAPDNATTVVCTPDGHESSDASTVILTPDHYAYPWTALASASLTPRGTALVSWPDGATLECHPMWLRENAPGPGGIDPVTRECELDPAHLHAGLSLSRICLDNGALAVTFEPERRNAAFHPGWLRHVADLMHLPFAAVPPAVPWTAHEHAEPVTHDGPRVLGDGAALTAALCDLARYGLIRLQRCGTAPDALARVAGLIGAMRDSNFGLTWHVDVDITPTSLANTGQRLTPHTDLPTREVPPGLQMLHCVENSVDGGWSTMADGLAIAEHLSQCEPDAFEALTTLEWVFFNRSPEHDHRWQGPVIDAGDGRLPCTYRAFHPVRAFPAMPVADMDRAYAALRLLSMTAGSQRFQLRYPFRPGDIVIFDNRRVLHGRDAFEPRAGARRRLIGTYMDTDELYSRLRVLLRRTPVPCAGDDAVEIDATPPSTGRTSTGRTSTDEEHPAHA